MLGFLANFSEYEYFHWLRLFDYVTFRAGGAGATAFLLAVILGKPMAKFLRHFRTTAPTRLGGLVPEEFIDREKDKTPSMAGLLIVGAIIVSTLLWGKYNQPIMWVLVVSIALFCLIGFADDYAKVVFKRRDGIPGRLKMLCIMLVSAMALYCLNSLPDYNSLYEVDRQLVPYNAMQALQVPFFKEPILVNCWYIIWPLDFLVIIGTANAVNLTDGKDGLATGCMVFSSLAYVVIAYLCGHKIFAGYLDIPYIAGSVEAVVFGAAMTGACIGFLWHNCHPASMFMGDTGSLALGGALGMLAVVVRQEILLILVGGVFVMEAGSVMLQVASFKLTGKRIFKCTPIHHHFERIPWTENQIVVRFWILAGLFALFALSTLKLR